MKKGFRRGISTLTAAVTALTLQVYPLPAVTGAADVILKIEGENLEGSDQLWTSIYQTEIPGYSGEGFAYLTAGALSFTVDVPADGMYAITVRGAQILDQDGRYQTVLAKTPSDVRAGKNSAQDIIRMFM